MLDILHNMERESSYSSPEGFTVFTSYFHKKRGYCCESLCLHCPFGLTLEKVGIEIRPVEFKDRNKIATLMSKELIHRRIDESHLKVYEITLKGFLCGLLIIENSNQDLILQKNFKDQGINLGHVECKMKALNYVEGQKA